MLGGNVGNKNKVVKKESNVVSGGSTPTKSRKAVALVLLIAIVPIIGIIFFLASGYDIKSITSPNCSKDNELINRYNTALQNTASNDEYIKINEIILNKIKYQDDISCSYILFNNYLKFGDFMESSKEYMRIKSLHDKGKAIPNGLFNENPDIDILLEQYKYYDSDATPEEAGEVWG